LIEPEDGLHGRPSCLGLLPSTPPTPDDGVTIESKHDQRDEMMSQLGEKVSRGIKSFVENPVTNLLKGIVLLLIGLSDASHTFRDDIAHGHVRIGHGLIIIGLFSILDALPHLIEGMEAWARYLELQEKKEPTKKPDNP
jgi:hypothetical protein